MTACRTHARTEALAETHCCGTPATAKTDTLGIIVNIESAHVVHYRVPGEHVLNAVGSMIVRAKMDGEVKTAM